MMGAITIDAIISIISAVIAIFSAMVAFNTYKASKDTLQRYDRELEFLRKQSRSHVFVEIQNALGNINNKIVEWDLDLTDYDENENLNIKDKQVIVWIIHHINLSVYTLAQEEIVESEYINMVRRRCIYNIEQLLSTNPKAKSWLMSVRDYMNIDSEYNRFDKYFFELVDEIALRMGTTDK